MVLPPHEDAAPVRQVVRHDGQPVPPGLHHRLHVVETVVPAQVGWLQTCIYLCGFLKLDDLLGCLTRPGEKHCGQCYMEGHTRKPTRVVRKVVTMSII
jgi:hypothetical protein